MKHILSIIIAIILFFLVVGFYFALYGCFIGLIYWLITLIFNISFVWKYLFIMTGIFTLFMILFGNINVKVETK